jgi:hypothetical protein
MQDIHPFVDIDARFSGYSEETARALSFYRQSLKPGLRWFIGSSQLETSYHFDTLVLFSGDRYSDTPIVFYAAHRAELELKVGSSLRLFAGGGQRSFREIGRTRLELDTGAAGGMQIFDNFYILGAITGRGHQAQNHAYSLLGLSALVSLEWLHDSGLSVRAGALASLDDYGESQGFFDADRARRDLLEKVSLSVFAPRRWDLKPGITYEYSQRYSSASQYSFVDHRVLLRCAWNFSWDPFVPATTTPPAHVAMEHSISDAHANDENRIRDMLQQDEAVQRGSSCVE